ncbi:helix-turn-helix domain-containing protein [Dyadobacter sp. 676]|uniref:Helix-turn-helix domain-containing protein n=1 Tax=Dyadobacter sp. 676 TaxID=3088362 RepID=A0AAU8FJL2_9BACT
MPISLFEHIIRNIAPGLTENVVPAPELRDMLPECFVARSDTFPRCGLAFNDAIPTAVFLQNPCGTATFRSGERILTVTHAWVSGQYLENVAVELHNPGEKMLVVRFNPVYFNQFSVTPARDLRNRLAWDLQAVFGSRVNAWLSGLEKQTDLMARVRTLESFLKSLGTHRETANHLLLDAVQKIVARKGHIQIEPLAASLNVGYKWLERSFMRATGVSPKEFARQQRFIHTYFDVVNRPEMDLPEIALRNAYYDQNHLSKEFKKFTGCSPGRLRKHHSPCRN